MKPRPNEKVMGIHRPPKRAACGGAEGAGGDCCMGASAHAMQSTRSVRLPVCPAYSSNGLRDWQQWRTRLLSQCRPQRPRRTRRKEEQ